MRKKLAAKAEPWYSAWEKCKPGAKEANAVSHAVAEWDANKDFYMGGDPVIAHKEALEWALTGNPANAAKAIAILNSWSSTLKSIPAHSMPQERLATGINANHFANAAELLIHGGPNGKKSGWSDADIQQFKKMLGLMYTTIEPFMSGFNGNWDAIMMDGMICMGVFLDDKAMFDKAVQHYLAGEGNAGIPKYVLASGQCQESARDQGHVQWGLGAMVAVCEVAWKQGVDLYGALDNRLMTGLEYTAKYMLGNDVPFEDKGKGVISPKGRGAYAPMWETAYQHYVYRKGLEMPFTKQIIFATSIDIGGRGKNAPKRPYRPEESYSAGICWGTFTMFKGAEDPQAVKKK